MKIMKKILLTLAVGCITVSVINAQTIPDRRGEGFKPHQKQEMGKRQHKMDLKSLNLTDSQKELFKSQRESYQKQLQTLQKNDGITVKEYRSQMENLHKDNKAKMDGILTTEQKAQLEKQKNDHKKMREIDNKARAEKMKLRLGLTDEQTVKMEKNRSETAAKMKTINENKSLSEDQKKEEMKNLMKAQKENTKSILTEDQLKKLQEGKKHHPEKMKDKKQVQPATI